MKTFTSSETGVVKAFPGVHRVRGGPMAADIIARPMAPPGRNDAWGGFATGWAATGTLLAGILVWGAIGYLLDRLAGTDPVFLAIGMVVGAAGGIYLVYVRYGRGDRDR